MILSFICILQYYNLMCSYSGLQDQLLALVVLQERPDLEEARSALVISSALMRKELKDIEDRILYKLSTSEGSPVDDIDLIVTLEASKIKSQEIKVRVTVYFQLNKYGCAARSYLNTYNISLANRVFK